MSGVLDMYSCRKFKEQLNEGITEQNCRVIFDMAQVSHVDSSGLGVLMQNCTRIQKMGGDLRLLKTAPNVKNVLDLILPNQYFEFYDDMQQALASIGGA